MKSARLKAALLVDIGFVYYLHLYEYLTSLDQGGESLESQTDCPKF